MWNKRVLLLSVLKLWLIVETLIMSENDGITVTQTVAHIMLRYAMWFVPFEEKDTIISSVSKPRCYNIGAGPYDTTTTLGAK